jgi:hypothetical protein
MTVAKKPKKPVTLTKAHQKKIDSAVKAKLKIMEKEFEKRVQVSVKEYIAKYMPDLEARQKELSTKIDRYDKLTNKHKPVFTAAEYRSILMALHTDGQRTKELLEKVFILVKDKESALTKK